MYLRSSGDASNTLTKKTVELVTGQDTSPAPTPNDAVIALPTKLKNLRQLNFEFSTNTLLAFTLYAVASLYLIDIEDYVWLV